MKISHFEGFSKAFSLVAENEADEVLLRRFLDLAPRTSLRAVAWQYEPVPKRPMERVVSRIDMRLVDRGAFEAREVDQPAPPKPADPSKVEWPKKDWAKEDRNWN